MPLLQIAAFIQIVSEVVYRYVSRFRQQYLMPLVFGPRDMFLLYNGHWVDGIVSVPQVDIRCIYSAANHTIMLVDEPNARTVRWPWLSVVTRDGADISEFFSSLRIGTDLRLLHLDILMLYAHQMGTLHLRGIEVMGRDGSPIII